MADPNRIGAARGADGRTLTDVYNQLGAVAMNLSNLSVMAEDLAFIRRSLTMEAVTDSSATSPYLSDRLQIHAIGNEGYPSLAVRLQGIFQMALESREALNAALGLMRGYQSPYGEEGGSYPVLFRDIQRLLKRLNDYIVGTGAVQPDRGEDFYGEMLKLDQWLTKLSTYFVGDGQQIARGEDFYTFAGNSANSLRDIAMYLGVPTAGTVEPDIILTLEAMRDALLNSNNNIRDIAMLLGVPTAGQVTPDILLALTAIQAATERSADCCEAAAPGGGAVVTPPGGGAVVTPPVDVCPTAVDGVKWMGFVQNGTQLINLQERTVFAGAFTAAPTPFIQDFSTTGAWNIYTLNGSQYLRLTLSWDFTGAPAQPIGFTLISSILGEPDGSRWGATEPVGLGDMTKGCASYDIDNSSFGNEDFQKFYFAFAFPIGTVPGGIPANVWLSSVNTGVS